MQNSGPIGRFARLWLRLKTQAQAWSAFFRFRSAFGWLGGDKSAENKGEILLISLVDWPPRLIMEGMIALSFRLRGYEVTVITMSGFHWAKRYLKVFGITKFIDLDVLQAEALQEVEAAGWETSLENNLSFQGLYKFNWADVGVGRHVLSTVVRQKKQGSIGFHDPEVLGLLKKFFPLSMQTALAGKKLFATMKPTAVLFLEKGYTPYGELFDQAVNANLNILQYFHGHRSDVLVMRRFNQTNKFMHPFSLSPKSWDRVKQLPWSKEREELFMEAFKKGYEDGTWLNRKFLQDKKRLKSPDEVRAQLGLDPAKKTAVVFSHVLWDATFFFGENLYPDYEQWLVDTVKIACENKEVQWVIKLHPDYAWKMQGTGKQPRDIIALESEVGDLPDHIQVIAPDTDISTYSFFTIADSCVTVRGTVGIEASCFGIPVITAGTGRYSHLGFTRDAKSVEEYRATLRNLQNVPRLSAEETSLARRHADALFSRRPLPMRTFEMVPALKGSTFGHETLIRVKSLEEVRAASDLHAFTDWVLESTDEDFLRMGDVSPLCRPDSQSQP